MTPGMPLDRLPHEPSIQRRRVPSRQPNRLPSAAGRVPIARRDSLLRTDKSAVGGVRRRVTFPGGDAPEQALTGGGPSRGKGAHRKGPLLGGRYFQPTGGQAKKGCWDAGVVSITRNRSHGFQTETETLPFNSLLQILSTLEKLFIKHGIQLHLADASMRYHSR